MPEGGWALGWSKASSKGRTELSVRGSALYAVREEILALFLGKRKQDAVRGAGYQETEKLTHLC